MNYIENIYICLMAPLLIAVLCTHRGQRRILLFLLGGMTVCLLSSYISTFLTFATGREPAQAALDLTPIIEECMKLAPVLFYLLVFEPGKKDTAACVLLIAIGFATFENACYLIQNGAADTVYLLIRGFGTGAMHVVCGAIVAAGLQVLWDRFWLRFAGLVGLLSLAITYHGVYNILVSQSGAAAQIGYAIPLVTTVLWLIFRRRLLSLDA